MKIMVEFDAVLFPIYIEDHHVAALERHAKKMNENEVLLPGGEAWTIQDSLMVTMMNGLGKLVSDQNKTTAGGDTPSGQGLINNETS